MKYLIASFAEQLKEAMEIGEASQITNHKSQITTVLISGLGGSGIGGTIVSQLVENECKIPVLTNKTYFIPAFVNQNTLVIICSYSGNTEETVNCLKEAIKKNAKIVCITSGGKIGEMAKKNNLDCIVIPGGMPPRACLGYPFSGLFYVLNKLEIINSDFKEKLIAAIALIEVEEKKIIPKAIKVAGELLDKIPVIYSDASVEGVAIRFRQQLNENSKILCWHHALPEMNHNELVGWKDKNEKLAVVVLRNKSDYQRNKERIIFTEKTVNEFTSNIIEIHSKGESNIENAIYLIHFCDWISFFLAQLRGVDAREVNIINKLKAELAKN